MIDFVCEALNISQQEQAPSARQLQRMAAQADTQVRRRIQSRIPEIVKPLGSRSELVETTFANGKLTTHVRNNGWNGKVVQQKGSKPTAWLRYEDEHVQISIRLKE